MPNGKTHNAINMAALVVATGIALATKQQLEQPVLLIGASAYIAGTFYLSPDLDLANRKRVVSKQAWGKLGWLWVPYGWMFRHRGMSHSWLVGPLTRLGYLALLCAPILALFKLLPLTPPTIDPNWLVAAGLGFYASQWLHLIADGIAPDKF
jgi:uncharacterized metal-binding protein